MGQVLEWRIRVTTDDTAKRFMSDEDLERCIGKNIERWTPGLDIMPMLSDWEIERV